MPSIVFGSLEAAREMRQKVGQYLTRTDDGRTTTVKLQSSTPDRIVERVKEASFKSRETRTRTGAEKTDLSKSERENLKRTTSFNWQQHGFQAMAVKGALKERGVDSWQDYYEPGEGVDSALAKLRTAKDRAGQSQNRASIGIESDRTDMESVGNMGRRSRQAEQVSDQQVKSAKRPAIVEGDTEAADFLREEKQFGADPFDISVSDGQASGRDVELVEERNQQRSQHARLTDDLQAAPKTTNPLVWASDPAAWDFPGVDTLEPEKVHERRSERAQEVDENELAPIADSPAEWAADPDQYDLPGIDTPGSDAAGGDMPMVDDRAQQDTLSFAADATEARESRTAVEQSEGGIMADTRETTDMGPDTNDVDPGSQAGLSDMDAAMNAMDEINDDVDETMGDIGRF